MFFIEFKVWFVHLTSIKFLTEYYLMSMSYHNMISRYKQTKYIVTPQHNVIILIEPKFVFLTLNLLLIICNFYNFFFQKFGSGKCDTRIPIKYQQVSYIKSIFPTYLLQSQAGQSSETHFLILLLKTVRKHASLIWLSILFHIFGAILAKDSIPKCVKWMFDLERRLPHLNS